MKRLVPLCCAAALLLSACSGVKQQLGVGRNSPDEFAVVKRAPLTLPPDYDLRPPAAESAPPAEDSADAARAAVLGEPKSPAAPAAPAGKNNGEQVLLEKMGAENADPDIRTVIDRDNGTIALKNKAVVDKLIFWKDTDPDAPDSKAPASVVDPKAEAERLKKNKEEGKPVNAGDVPAIEKKQSTFDRLFKD